MLNIKIITVRKNKEKWLIQAIDDYVKRLSSYIHIDWEYCKNDTQLEKILNHQCYICLDPEGTMYDSVKFSKYLFSCFAQMGSKLIFVIGGAEGIPNTIKKEAFSLISLSPMTFTHQMSRLIIIEQIYRALQIEQGTPYHN